MTIMHVPRVAAVRSLTGLIAFIAIGLPALATEPQDMSYWISMRGIPQESGPSFVVAAYVANGSYTTLFAGCRGRTYYLRSSDAAIVQAARTGGETVQIHRGEPGTAPQQSTVICLIQADQ